MEEQLLLPFYDYTRSTAIPIDWSKYRKKKARRNGGEQVHEHEHDPE